MIHQLESFPSLLYFFFFYRNNFLTYIKQRISINAYCDKLFRAEQLTFRYPVAHPLSFHPFQSPTSYIHLPTTHTHLTLSPTTPPSKHFEGGRHVLLTQNGSGFWFQRQHAFLTQPGYGLENASCKTGRRGRGWGGSDTNFQTI